MSAHECKLHQGAGHAHKVLLTSAAMLSVHNGHDIFHCSSVQYVDSDLTGAGDSDAEVPARDNQMVLTMMSL